MKDNIEIIRKACIRANPSIMKLGLECEVMVTWGGIRTGFFNEPIKAVVVLVEKDQKGIRVLLSTGTFVKKFSPRNLHIIGRPIRLSDVLLAIGDQGLVSMSIHIVGDLRSVSFIWEPIGQMKHMTWNLLDDDLSHQSKETIEFIASLLSESK